MNEIEDLEIDYKKMIFLIRYVSPYNFMNMGSMHQNLDFFDDEDAIDNILLFEFEQMIQKNTKVILK